jgi:mRNA interferase MazF
VIHEHRPQRGDIWRADLGDGWGWRPVVLLSRHDAYDLLTWVMVAPTTSRLRQISTTLMLDPAVDPVPKDCTLLLDHVQSIRQERLIEPIGRLSEARMAAVDLALHTALGMETCPPRRSTHVG